MSKEAACVRPCICKHATRTAASNSPLVQGRRSSRGTRYKAVTAKRLASAGCSRTRPHPVKTKSPPPLPAAAHANRSFRPQSLTHVCEAPGKLQDLVHWQAAAGQHSDEGPAGGARQQGVWSDEAQLMVQDVHDAYEVGVPETAAASARGAGGGSSKRRKRWWQQEWQQKWQQQQHKVSGMATCRQQNCQWRRRQQQE